MIHFYLEILDMLKHFPKIALNKSKTLNFIKVR